MDADWQLDGGFSNVPGTTGMDVNVGAVIRPSLDYCDLSSYCYWHLMFLSASNYDLYDLGTKS